MHKDPILEKLIEKLMTLLKDLNLGCNVDKKLLSECWELLHLLHYSKLSPNIDSDLIKILDYYG